MSMKKNWLGFVLLGLLSPCIVVTNTWAQSENQHSSPELKTPQSGPLSSVVTLNPLWKIRPDFPVPNPVPMNFVTRRPEARDTRNDEPGIAQMETDWSHGVMVKAESDRTEFRQLQRIRVIAEVKNISDTHRWLPPSGINRYRLTRIRVFNGKGEALPKTQFYEHEGAGLGVIGMTSGAAGSAFTSGASFRVDLIANLVYDMTRPGDYWIVVEIPMAHSLRGPRNGEMLYARAKPLKVKVLPEPAVAPGDFVPDPERP